MCRLYGIRANELTKVECSLVYAQNALMHQSRGDQRGECHSDGWGIGFYDGHRAIVEKRNQAAWKDLHFAGTAERVYARTVVAHVRNATVGGISQENTHPFLLGRWVFTHNGTVRPIEELAAQLERETCEDFEGLRRGDTDSELVFYWLLSRLRNQGVDLEAGAESVSLLSRTFVEAVGTLVERSRAFATERPTMLNFMLSDGRHLVASRYERTLWWLDRVGVRDCEICGIPHVHHDPSVSYRAAVVASEPITNENWREVPDASVVAIGEDARATIVGI